MILQTHNVKKTILILVFIQSYFAECQSQLTLGSCGIKPPSCPSTKYRSLDGSCNNLRKPVWGMPQTRYGRLLPPKYANGIDFPTTAQSGKPLPPAREVSVKLYPALPIEDPVYSLAAMQYGQFISHDMSITANNTQTTHQEKCCSMHGRLLQNISNPDICYPILVGPNDPLYSKEHIVCFDFARTGTDRDYGCALPNRPVEQLTGVTHYLDLSTVYGSSDQLSKQLRLFQGGRLRSERREHQEWLPRNPNVKAACMVEHETEPCYLAGDSRVNQNTHLTVLQIIFLREHNRIADALAKLNPHWDDETLFQEARKICIAQHQFISYYYWLPIFLGRKNLLKTNEDEDESGPHWRWRLLNTLIHETDGYVNDYDDSVNPSVLNEHATAAFRFFHSNIAGLLRLITNQGHDHGILRISNWWNRPLILEKHRNNFDELAKGLVTQSEYAPDRYHTREITNFWQKPIGKILGHDLKAICIQRNRDHGLASYNDMRGYCGLPRAHKFEDFADVIPMEDAMKLKSLYEVPDDVDLTVGGSLETLVPGAQAGPTFLCILTEQFYRTRVGDRFFFENSGVGGFTLKQLKEIRKSSLSRLFCDNTNITTIQQKDFIKPSLSNPEVPCEQLPFVDLSKWKDSKSL